MDADATILKYTGHHLPLSALRAAFGEPGADTLTVRLASEILDAARAVGRAENEQTGLAGTLTNAISRVETTITAAPGGPGWTLNDHGELGWAGQRFDTLLGIRADRITRLCVLVDLWNLATGGTGPVDESPTGG